MKSRDNTNSYHQTEKNAEVLTNTTICETIAKERTKQNKTKQNRNRR